MKIRKTGSLLFVIAVITILSIATISLTGCGEGCCLGICPAEQDESAITAENGIEVGPANSADEFSADKENVEP